jgi:leader peptidase (prepilin peptidase) / N-methyltransferase
MTVFKMLDASPEVFIALAILLGLTVGSFLNVAIYRLPKMLEAQWQVQCAELRGETAREDAPYNLLAPRSRCPHCGHFLSALQNIPVLSFLVLKGRCAHCRHSISWRYPVIEALTAILSAFVAWRYGVSLTTLAALVFCWALVVLIFIDLDTQLLPDSITLPLLWIGLIVNLGGTFIDLPSAVIGAVAGYLALWLVYWAFKLVTGKEGMGYGDFKLLAALGAWLGWQILPLVILLSSMVGAAVGILLIAFGRHGKSVPIPFGPYLASAGLLALFWGPALMQKYWHGF